MVQKEQNVHEIKYQRHQQEQPSQQQNLRIHLKTEYIKRLAAAISTLSGKQHEFDSSEFPRNLPAELPNLSLEPTVGQVIPQQTACPTTENLLECTTLRAIFLKIPCNLKQHSKPLTRKLECDLNPQVKTLDQEIVTLAGGETTMSDIIAHQKGLNSSY